MDKEIVKAKIKSLRDQINELEELLGISDDLHLDDKASIGCSLKVNDRIKVILSLQRFHDLLCPDYQPNWNNYTECKYYIYFDYMVGLFRFTVTLVDNYQSIYFPNSEIAEKICNCLNKEFSRES